MFGQPRTIIWPVTCKYRGQLIHFKLLLQSGEQLGNASRLPCALGAGRNTSLISERGLMCTAILFLTVTYHHMHSVTRLFSCLVNPAEVIWIWDWIKESSSPFQGAANKIQSVLKVYSWQWCVVGGAPTYWLLSQQHWPWQEKLVLMSKTIYRCDRNARRIHQERKTKPCLCSFIPLLCFKYWVTKSFFLSLVALGWWEKSDMWVYIKGSFLNKSGSLQNQPILGFASIISQNTHLDRL